jgi:hypothetical protein
MKDTILNLDSNINLKNKSIEANIKYIIKKYGSKVKLHDKPFHKYFTIYKLIIYYDKNSMELMLYEKINPVSNRKTYVIKTSDKTDKNNFINSSKDDNTWPGVEIAFLLKMYKKNEAYIEYIAKNEKHQTESGTKAINLAVRLCKYLHIRNVYLQDASTIECVKKNDMDLALYKILTTGNTWYEKHGFNFDIKDYKYFNKAIKKVQNIDVNEILKIMIKFRNAIQYTISSGRYNDLKFWTPLSIKYTQHNLDRLTWLYTLFSENIVLLKKTIKPKDTLKKYSIRVGKECCKTYINTIQTMLFTSNLYNTSDHRLVGIYKNDIIAYPNIKELFMINLLVNNWEIKYKKKL